MKKHLFSFLMVLALVVLAGTSANAQDGMLTTTSRDVMIGAISQFSVTESGAGEAVATSYAWTVLYGTVAGGEAQSGSATAATDWSFATSLADPSVPTTPTGTSCFIKFNAAAPAATPIYIVEATSTNASCTTRRRFYVSIIDFEVVVYLSNASGAPIGADVNVDTPETICNSWSGDVITNALSGAQIAAQNQSHENTVTTENKVTTTYYSVRITLIGAVLTNYKWRFNYSMPAQDDLHVYQISGPADVAFGSEAGSNTITAAAPTGEIAIATPGVIAAPSVSFSGNQAVYVDNNSANTGATATYTFAVQSHNLHGGNNVAYNVRIDQVQLENSTATDYNNGEKYASVHTVNAGKLADAISGIRTINQSPATSVIGIAD